MSTEDVGTLVAIAIGGQCTFFVDGHRRGTSSSIRLNVPVGRHTVRCVAEEGSRGRTTQVVSVARGKPGIASFRIN